MKVKIGPYINYFGVFQLTDLFLKPFIKDEDKLFDIGADFYFHVGSQYGVIEVLVFEVKISPVYLSVVIA
jgi:hypothetical protein